MRAPPVLTGLLAISLSLSTVRARALEPTGTPKPSRDAPGDKPGRGSPFGSEGGRALESSSPAQAAAASLTLFVERIEVSGNHRVGASSIVDRLAFHVGDRLTPEAVLLSRARLFQLGAFSGVEIDTEPGTTPYDVVVRVAVEERLLPLIVSDLMVGHTAVSPLYGSLAASVPQAFGNGIGASVASALDGHGRHGLKLTLYQPALPVAGHTWVGGTQLIWAEGLESGCSTPRCGGQFSAIPWVRYRRSGGEVDVGIRPGVFTRFVMGYRFEALYAAGDPGVVPAARPVIREGSSRLSALVVAFDSDSRDDAFLPSTGTRLEVNATIGSSALGSSYEYSRYLFQLERWFPQGGGRALRLDFALGLVQGDAPFFERFYAADFSYFSVGLASARALGINFSPDSRYDALLGVLGGEYDLNLWRAPGKLLSRGVAAFGIRGVYTAARPDSGRSPISFTPISFDVALRMQTPIGVIEISLAYVVDQILKAIPLSFPGLNSPP